jgi:replicative DNA helicase
MTTASADTDRSTLSERILAIAAGLADIAHQASFDEATLRERVESVAGDLRKIAREGAAAPLTYTADGLAQSLIDDFGVRRAVSSKNGGIVGLRTGFGHLDETLNGLEKGKLYALAAMPGAGKTTLALQMAATAAQAGELVLYLSLENDAVDLARKTACRLGDVSYTMALKGKMHPEQWDMAVGELEQLNGNLFLATPRDTMPDLHALIEDIQARAGRGVTLVVIDYLQAWVKRSATAGESADVRERIDRFAPALRSIGELYGCAVLAISSQNRAGYNPGSSPSAEKGMSALKESGDIEYTCDALMTLQRVQEKDAPTLIGRPGTPLRLSVDKNRQGLTGKPIHLILHGDRCRLAEVEAVL